MLQACGWTLLHRRSSEAAVRRCFYKIGVLENFAKFTVARLKRLHHKCFPVILWNFQEHLFSNRPLKSSNASAWTNKQSNITEIGARVFISILQNICRSWAIIFSQGPKVVFWTNCAFPLRNRKKLPISYVSLISLIKKISRIVSK